jgi:hypothetical protein
VRIRLLLGAAIAVTTVAMTSFSAAGGAPSFTVTPNPAQPGDVLTLAGDSCPDETVLAALYDPETEEAIGETGSTESEVDGTWSGLEIIVPADTPPGLYAINATCNDPNTPFTLGTVEIQIGGEPEPEPEPGPDPEPAPAPEPVQVAPTLTG